MKKVQKRRCNFTTTKPIRGKLSLMVILFLSTFISPQLMGQDYTISTAGGNLVITDIAGNGETLEVTQTVAGSNLNFNAAGRTYSLNGGGNTAFPVAVSLAGITSVEINAGNGNDIIYFGNVVSGNAITNMPNLTINGDDGNDLVHAEGGKITFLADASLNIDMTDDASVGDNDILFMSPVGNNYAEWLLSGTGTATVKVSGYVYIGIRSRLSTINGDMLIEGNWNGNTTGTFSGVHVDNISMLGVNPLGTGQVTVRGKGGDTGNDNYGVRITGGDLIGGSSGTTLIEGQGGPSTGQNNHGVYVGNLSGALVTWGSNLTVNGTGGGIGAAQRAAGVFMGSSGALVAGGTGTTTVTGIGSPATGWFNYGIQMVNTGTIGSTGNGGDLILTGTVGANTTQPEAEDIVGVNMHGRQSITMNGTTGGVSGNFGVPNTSPRNASATQTSTFGPNTKFRYYIGGSTQGGASAGRYYPWHIQGLIDLNGAELITAGTNFVPTATQDYAIMFNDGADPVQGTFTYMGNTLNEGDQVLNFRGSSDIFYITYRGGDGNDIILTPTSPAPDYIITTTGGNMVVTDISGNSDSLSVTQTVAGPPCPSMRVVPVVPPYKSPPEMMTP